jgi:xanthine dehydrogenase accessory factor
MHELLDSLTAWQAQGDSITLATVIKTWGSSPRKTGAKMAMTADGKIIGSVSGGCVEGAVIEAGAETLVSNQPQRLEYGVADETAWSVGLACGGHIEVFVEPLSVEHLHLVKGWFAQGIGGAVATVVQGADNLLGRKLFISGSGTVSGSIAPELDQVATQVTKQQFASRQSQQIELANTAVTLFVDVILLPPTLIIVGGGHISVVLAQMARLLDFCVVVVEPRRAFGNETRFPQIDQIIQAWPQKAFQQISLTPNTAVAILTHDPKIDDPALAAVLTSPLFYIGVLGSKHTQNKRQKRFMEKGFSAESLRRIRGPIGLDINAQTPEEIALAIMAEIIHAYRS